MVQTKYSAAVGFTLFLTVATAADTQLLHAQTSPNPAASQDAKVRIAGSSSMGPVNAVLKQRFEKQASGTQIVPNTVGTSGALQAVLDGKADLAAIGRPLTDQEKAKGLNAVPIGRDKIAILIGDTNPFAKSLNIAQFARMFRGEITNWSQVGGPSAPIRFIDRPDSSDTRQAFSTYPVFKQGKFETGKTATKLKEDTAQAVIKALGDNGISYSTVNQIRNQKGVKAVTMHGTQPTDPRYPFSQPLYYIYKGTPDGAVQAFLKFATAPEGQTAIEQAGVADTVAESAAQGAPVTGTNNPAGGQAGVSSAPSNAQGGNAPSGSSLGGFTQGGGTASSETGAGQSPLGWLWWLLPIGSGAALLWMLGKGRRHSTVEGDTGHFTPPTPGWGSNGFPGDSNPSTVTPPIEGGLDPMQGDTTGIGTGTPTHFTGDVVQTGQDLAGDAINTGGDLFGKATNLGGAALAGGAAAAAGVGAAAWGALSNRGSRSRVVLQPRSANEAEVFWDIPTEERQAVRQQGGERLGLRLYDVTDIDLDTQSPHSIQQFECDELTQRQRLPIALPDRDYLAEVGYLTRDAQWLGMARSTHVHIPSAPSFSTSPKPDSTPTTGDIVDAEKPFLAGDVDPATQPATDSIWGTTQPTEGSSTSWFQQVSQKTSDVANDVTQAGGGAMAGGAAMAGGTAAAAWSFLSQNGAQTPETSTPAIDESTIEPAASPFSAGDADFVTGETHANSPSSVTSSVSEGRLVLTPRNSHWAYAYWDIPRMQRAQVERPANANLVMRLYDVTDTEGLPDRYEQFDVDDLALSCDVPIPRSDRNYVAEIGYVDGNNHWTRLAQSETVWVGANLI
jgi:phosphate transport system substrate-binding protein